MLGNARVAAVLPVRDLTRAREFYSRTLGLREIREMSGGGAVFECGGGSLLSIYERPGTNAVEHTQAAFEVSDLEAEMRELKSKGIRFEDYDLPNLRTENGIANAGGMKAAWFKDPDGNIINIVQIERTGGIKMNL